jgi:hypothetical protein
VSVVLSSHVLAELERVADYLVLVSGGRVQMAGEVDDLLAAHRVLAAGNQAVSPNAASPFSSALFDLRGVSFAAWTLVAFAIGGLAGMLIRRVVPAIVANMVAYTALALVAANVLRRHYLTPLLTTNPNVPGTAWIYSQRWTKNGKLVFTSWRDAPNALIQQCRSLPAGPLGKPTQATLAQCFAQHGYVQLTKYQPASRFWAFQWIEGGWLLALSVLLIAVTVWLVRRRALCPLITGMPRPILADTRV